jgi:predicted flap endonuclease-1-like 5' DNA nuclease
MAKLHEQIAQASETSLAKAPVAPIPLALLSSSSDQLTLIRGIDAAAASLLNDNGIHSFSDIAALTAEDVAELGRMLGDKRRVSKQGWVEQAALLADGIETAHSRRVRAGDFASTVPAPAGHPVTGPKTAQVIDLAERRAKRRGAGPFIHKAAIYRLAAVAASAAVFVLSFDGADLIEQLISAFWIKGGCSIPLTALFSQCTVALLQ